MSDEGGLSPMLPTASPEPNPRLQWELYTERAREVIVLAQRRASELNHDRIGTLHLLLGLVDEGDGLAARVLGSLSISAAQLREQAIRRMRSSAAKLPGRIPFAEDAEKALEQAVRRSKDLGYSYVGTEHLLLALVGDSESDAAQALLDLGAAPQMVTTRTLSRLASLPRSRVFLCHSSADKPAVRGLYHRLRSDGLRPWFDEQDLVPGEEWDRAIRRAVRGADCVVVCLSRTSTTRAGYVHKEIKEALDVADEQPEGTIFVIPARLEECEVPDRLRHLHWVDLFSTIGYQRLLAAVGVPSGSTAAGPTIG
jgi:hypothetical protein